MSSTQSLQRFGAAAAADPPSPLTGVDITDLHDEYGAVLEQVVTAKLEGLGWAEPPEPQPALDLMQGIRQARRGEHQRAAGRPDPAPRAGSA